MKQFKRTAEKILAWIGNVFLILLVLLVNLIAFSSSVEKVIKDPTLRNQLLFEAQKTNPTLDEKTFNIIIESFIPYARTYAIILVVLLVLALLASFTMKKRIFSGILFLILALATALFTALVAVVIYVPYLIVAILLFIRKEQVDYNNLYNNTQDENVTNTYV